MRRLIATALCFFLFVSQVSAYDLTSRDLRMVESATSKLEKQLDGRSESTREKLLTKLERLGNQSKSPRIRAMVDRLVVNLSPEYLLAEEYLDKSGLLDDEGLDMLDADSITERDFKEILAQLSDADLTTVGSRNSDLTTEELVDYLVQAFNIDTAGGDGLEFFEANNLLPDDVLDSTEALTGKDVQDILFRVLASQDSGYEYTRELGQAYFISATINITNNVTITDNSTNTTNIDNSTNITDNSQANSNNTVINNNTTVINQTQTNTTASNSSSNSQNNSNTQTSNTNSQVNTDSTISSTACASGQHMENKICVSNTRACAIENGTGELTWNGSTWGTCLPKTCGEGYAARDGACKIVKEGVLEYVQSAHNVQNTILVGSSTEQTLAVFNIRGRDDDLVLQDASFFNLLMDANGNLISSGTGYQIDTRPSLFSHLSLELSTNGMNGTYTRVAELDYQEGRISVKALVGAAVIPEGNANVYLRVRGSLSIPSASNGLSGRTIKVGMTGLKIASRSSGKEIPISVNRTGSGDNTLALDSNIGKIFVLRKSRPNFSTPSTANGTLTTTKSDIFKFTMTPDSAGQISLARLVFRIEGKIAGQNLADVGMAIPDGLQSSTMFCATDDGSDGDCTGGANETNSRLSNFTLAVNGSDATTTNGLKYYALRVSGVNYLVVDFAQRLSFSFSTSFALQGQVSTVVSNDQIGVSLPKLAGTKMVTDSPVNILGGNRIPSLHNDSSQLNASVIWSDQTGAHANDSNDYTNDLFVSDGTDVVASQWLLRN